MLWRGTPHAAFSRHQQSIALEVENAGQRQADLNGIQQRYSLQAKVPPGESGTFESHI